MTRRLVIAHRGASGYLPEHTLEAKALAHEMGADYLEQDVVATRDDELVVLHDVFLDDVTDVATRFPDRARDDGRFYVRDFDLAELRGLKVWERMNPDGTPVYPGRYPPRTGEFHVHTFAEEIDFVQRLNAKSGREAGIYPEIKRPAWHREQGIDVTPGFLGVLARAGYTRRDDRVFVQCFDDAELRRIRTGLGCRLKLVQLIGENGWHESAADYEGMRTRPGDWNGWPGPWTPSDHGSGSSTSCRTPTTVRSIRVSSPAHTRRASPCTPTPSAWTSCRRGSKVSRISSGSPSWNSASTAFSPTSRTASWR